MNILEIANYSAPYTGNFILSLRNLESHLVDGKAIYLFPEAAKGKEFVNELGNVYFYSGNLVSDVLLIKKIVSKYNIDIVHSHFSSSYESLFLKLGLLIVKREVHCVRHIHSEYQQISGYRKLIRTSLRSYVDAYIPCNYPIANQLVSDGVSPSKVHTVLNAIDFSRLNQFEHVEKKNGIDIYMFGFDWYRKGGDIAIKAISKLENTRLNIVLSSFQEEVKANIKKDFGEIPDFVKLLPSRNDVATYFHHSDLFISPSRSEGLPYSVIEAMYCETLVVLSDIGPHANILPDEFMFQSEKAEDLTKVIKHVIELENKEEIKLKLKENAVENYNLDNWSLKILDIFKKLLVV